MRAWCLGLIGLLATACCATPPQPLQFTWHLIRVPDASGPAGETGGQTAGGVFVDQPSTRPAPPARHRLLLSVINTGPAELEIPGLTVTGGASPHKRVKMTLPAGGVRVIDLGMFDCWVPVSVTLAGTPASEKGSTLRLPAVPSAFPEDMNITCPWSR